MSRVCQKIGQFIESWDFFAAPILLRYGQDEDKSTKTAGCLSITIVVVLAAAFSNSWLALLNKDQLYSDLTIYKETDPSGISLNSSQFILAVDLQGFNISESTGRYFDIEFTQESRINASQIPSETIKMEPCNRQTWETYGDQFVNIYDMVYLSYAVCFPENFIGRYEGKWTSEAFQYLRIHVKECSGTGCKNSTQFKDYLTQNGTFFLNVYFINKVINPSEIEPVSIYFEDKNYYALSSSIAIDVNLYLTEYQISTDESLWPWEQEEKKKGVLIDRTQTESWIYPVQNGTYASIYFRKSDQKMTISRSFRKIDDLLSYLGGLFGIFVFLFGFLMRYYNQCCFQLDLCHDVFRGDDQDQNRQRKKQNVEQASDKFIPYESERQNFNFFIYLQYLFYLLFKKICCCCSWKKMKNIEDKLTETRHQLNIDQLLQKISFFEKANECILEEDQIKLLYLQEKFSIKELQNQRINMNIYYELQDESEGQNNTVSNEYFLENHEKVNKEKDRRMSCANYHEVFGKRNSIVNNGNLEHEIVQALNKNKERKKKGDMVAAKILDGVREDIRYRYQDKKTSNFISRKGTFFRSSFKPFTSRLVIEEVSSSINASSVNSTQKEIN